MLERLDRARARGARIYAEVAGYGAIGRCLPHHCSGGRGRRRCRVDAAGIEYCRPARRCRRLHQCSRHQHAAQRCHRDAGDQGRLRRTRLPAGDQLNEEHDRPPDGGGRRHRRRSSASLALRDQVLPPTINLREADPALRPGLCAEHRPARPRSMSHSPIPLASVGTTQPCMLQNEIDVNGHALRARSTGWGMYVPERVMTNAELERWWTPPTSGSSRIPACKSDTSVHPDGRRPRPLAMRAARDRSGRSRHRAESARPGHRRHCHAGVHASHPPPASCRMRWVPPRRERST